MYFASCPSVDWFQEHIIGFKKNLRNVDFRVGVIGYLLIGKNYAISPSLHSLSINMVVNTSLFPVYVRFSKTIEILN